ncbi:DUF2187 family protein [Caldibacillus debilis]|uniref:DUF2187 family protein n=1 Tax=Caldibacillus debilis TaxID=301148 RepID=UPI003C2C2F00
MTEKDGMNKDAINEEEMTEGSESQRKKTKIVKADVGDTIQIKRGIHKGKKGKVLIVRENSVIVEFGKNPKTGEPLKTVVNHKNYKLVK